MNRKEIDETRWSGYSLESGDLPEDVMEDCLSVLSYLNSKKADVVNWEERAEMDRITRAKGGKLLTDEQEAVKPEAFSSNEKENDLMSGFADIMNQLEEIDGNK